MTFRLYGILISLCISGCNEDGPLHKAEVAIEECIRIGTDCATSDRHDGETYQRLRQGAQESCLTEVNNLSHVIDNGTEKWVMNCRVGSYLGTYTASSDLGIEAEILEPVVTYSFVLVD